MNSRRFGESVVFFQSPGKNILNCENVVEIKVIGQLAL